MAEIHNRVCRLPAVPATVGAKYLPIVKDHIRVASGDDDDYLRRAIRQGISLIEQTTRRVWVEREAVEAVEASESGQAVAAVELFVDVAGLKPAVQVNDRVTVTSIYAWDNLAESYSREVEIAAQTNADYTTYLLLADCPPYRTNIEYPYRINIGSWGWDEMPAVLERALVMMMADLYTQRRSVQSVGSSLVPYSTIDLLRSYTRWGGLVTAS